MYPPSPSDPPQLTSARDEISDWIGRILPKVNYTKHHHKHHHKKKKHIQVVQVHNVTNDETVITEILQQLNEHEPLEAINKTHQTIESESNEINKKLQSKENLTQATKSPLRKDNTIEPATNKTFHTIDQLHTINHTRNTSETKSNHESKPTQTVDHTNNIPKAKPTKENNQISHNGKINVESQSPITKSPVKHMNQTIEIKQLTNNDQPNERHHTEVKPIDHNHQSVESKLIKPKPHHTSIVKLNSTENDQHINATNVIHHVTESMPTQKTDHAKHLELLPTKETEDHSHHVVNTEPFLKYQPTRASKHVDESKPTEKTTKASSANDNHRITETKPTEKSKQTSAEHAVKTTKPIDHTQRTEETTKSIDHTQRTEGTTKSIDHTQRTGETTKSIDHTQRTEGTTKSIDHTQRTGETTKSIDHTQRTEETTKSIDHTQRTEETTKTINHTQRTEGTTRPVKKVNNTSRLPTLPPPTHPTGKPKTTKQPIATTISSKQQNHSTHPTVKPIGKLNQNSTRNLSNHTTNLNETESCYVKYIYHVDQKLDNFDSSNNETWKNYYYERSDFYKPDGPVFLQLRGENSLDPCVMTDHAWLAYGKRFNAYLFQLEQRYYGFSMPTKNLSDANMRYLTIDQTLADIENFILNTTTVYNFNSNNKWIIMGGSYAGSLAVWMAEKYPGLIYGVIGSSAPLQLEVNFYQYLKAVTNTIRKHSGECMDAIQEAINYVGQNANSIMTSSVEDYSGLTLCDSAANPNELDKSFLIYDLVGDLMNVVQYNGVNIQKPYSFLSLNETCNVMTNKSIGSPFQRLSVFNSLALNNSNCTCTNYQYNVQVQQYQNISLQSETIIKGNRQWLWQVCTEMGFFQTTDAVNDIFGNSFNVDFFLSLCTSVFNSYFDFSWVSTVVNINNAYYGGLHPNISNALIVQGSADPWHLLGLNHNSPHNHGIEVIVIEGTAHCANMYPPSPSDPPQLTAARDEISDWIGNILAKAKQAELAEQEVMWAIMAQNDSSDSGDNDSDDDSGSDQSNESSASESGDT